jgi:sigma-B regulation protein RsbU (phosphoserine phosphatase)
LYDYLSLNIDEIATYPLFRELPLKKLDELLKRCQSRLLKAGEILLTPGAENHHLYWLLSGQLQVYLSENQEFKNVPRQGFPILPGESIGEMSIIDSQPVSALVIAEEDCQLLVMSEQIFWEEFVYLPQVIKIFLQGLSFRLRQRDEITLKNLEQQLKFEYLQKELAAASKIQTNILPHQNPLFPDHPQVDVFATLEPATEVGGDFFDAFPLDETHICIAIGDVSGKGIPAALFMIRVVTLLRLSISQNSPLATIIESLNRHLCEGNEDCMFVTLFVGIFDVISGKLTYVNGGHNWPFFARNNENFQIIKVTGGMLLGISPDACYTSSELTLEQDDTLVLYTDGVTEAEDSQGEFFSLARTGQVLDSLSRNANAREIALGLQEAVFSFSNPARRSDDTTILVLRFRAIANDQVTEVS